MWVVGATTATRATRPSLSIRWATQSPSVVLPAAGVAEARKASPGCESTAAAAACCQARSGGAPGQGGRERPAIKRGGASISYVTGRAKLDALPDAKPARIRNVRGRRVPIAERGPGWSYRPDEGPGRHQPGVSTPRLGALAFGAFDLDGPAADTLRAWTEVVRASEATITLGLGPGACAPDRRP